MEASSVKATDLPTAIAWNDPKRYLWLLGLVVPLLPFIAWGTAQLTGLGIGYWFGPFVVFVVIPALFTLIGPTIWWPALRSGR